MGMLSACTSESGLEVQTGQDNAEGKMALAFTGSAPTRGTTTTISPEEAKTFLITVSQGGTVVRGPQTLGTMDMRFPVGQGYSVYAESCTEADAHNPEAAPIITDSDIEAIETIMDKLDVQLPKLTRFILPGGSKSAARAHICRTVCRRAERNTYKVADEFEIEENILIFLNRLSDFFFLTARFESQKTGKEMYWEH